MCRDFTRIDVGDECSNDVRNLHDYILFKNLVKDLTLSVRAQTIQKQNEIK